MKISELIETLEKIKELHGDLIVTCTSNEIGGINDIQQINIHNDFDRYMYNPDFLQVENIETVSIESWECEYKNDDVAITDKLIGEENKYSDDIPF